MIRPLELPRNSCAWKVGLATSFRNISSKIMRRWGTNLQNPSDNILQLYIPDTGKKFIQVDEKGADARIVAWLCKAGNYRKLFENDLNVHA